MSLLAFLSGNELIWVIVLALVVFGGSQIPKLARNLGRAQKELQKGLAEGAADADRAEGAADADRAEGAADADRAEGAADADRAEDSSD